MADKVAAADMGVAAYDAVLRAFADRREKRRGWSQRCEDPVFRGMREDCRPLPPPLRFDARDSEGASPLPCDLSGLEAEVSSWRAAFASRKETQSSLSLKAGRMGE
jgi:hypothetical protein